MRVNQREEYGDAAFASRTEYEAQYRAIKERVHAPPESPAERSAAGEELVHMAGLLLAFCFENNLIADNGVDPIVEEILLDGIASETPHLLHMAFQTCMAFGRVHLSLLFGTRILESPKDNWIRDYGLCPELQATCAELYVMTKQPDRAIELFQQCIDWPSTLNILKSAYHQQIARCYRVSGQSDKEKYHSKRANYFKSLPEPDFVFGACADEDAYDEAAPVFDRFHVVDNSTISGDFLIWLGNFASAEQLVEYVKSDSDDWEPASALNSVFGFALLEGQSYGESELSVAWTKKVQKVNAFLAPLAHIAELPELAAKAASRASIEFCNSAVVFHDANRTYFVENPFPADSPLRYLGRFSYTEPGRFVAVSTDPYPSNLRMERADSCLAERHFKQAETFLRAELDEHRNKPESGSTSALLKLCVVLVANADEIFQFGQEVQGEQKFKESMQLFSELVNGGGWLPEFERSDDLSQFFYHCENYALRLENSDRRGRACEIYKTLFELSQRHGDDTNPENKRWQLAIDRCSN